MTLFHTDPSDKHEEVKEYTPEEIFYNDETYTPEHAMTYISHLERVIKAKNKDLDELLGQTSEHLAHHLKQLNLIRKI